MKFKLLLIAAVLFTMVVSCKKEGSTADTTKGEVKKEEVKKEVAVKDAAMEDTEFKAAQDLVKNWKYPEAITKLEALKTKYPESSAVFATLGSIYKKQVKDDLAIENLEKAVKLDGKNVEASKELAKLYYFKKMDDKAVELWKKITELVPEDKTAFYELGHMQYITKDYDGAIASFEKSIKNDPKHEWSYYYMAESYNYGKKNVEKSKEVILKGLEAIPENKNLMLKMATTLSYSQDYKGAIEWNEKVLKLNQKDSYVMENIALNYSYMKEYDKEIEWLTKALEIMPKDTYLMSKIANAYANKQDFKTAVATYEDLLKLKDDYYYKYQLGLVYVKMKDKKGVQKMIDALKADTNQSAPTYLKYLETDLKNLK